MEPAEPTRALVAVTEVAAPMVMAVAALVAIPGTAVMAVAPQEVVLALAVVAVVALDTPALAEAVVVAEQACLAKDQMGLEVPVLDQKVAEAAPEVQPEQTEGNFLIRAAVTRKAVVLAVHMAAEADGVTSALALAPIKALGLPALSVLFGAKVAHAAPLPSQAQM